MDLKGERSFLSAVQKSLGLFCQKIRCDDSTHFPKEFVDLLQKLLNLDVGHRHVKGHSSRTAGITELRNSKRTSHLARRVPYLNPRCDFCIFSRINWKKSATVTIFLWLSNVPFVCFHVICRLGCHFLKSDKKILSIERANLKFLKCGCLICVAGPVR